METQANTSEKPREDEVFGLISTSLLLESSSSLVPSTLLILCKGKSLQHTLWVTLRFLSLATSSSWSDNWLIDNYFLYLLQVVLYLLPSKY